jgi:hypothetical protein
MKAEAFTQGNVYLASSIPLRTKHKGVTCDTQIVVG